jgi:hypothetical protein
MRVQVFHARHEESGPLLEACRAAGVDVGYDTGGYVGFSRAIRAQLPDAFVLDLSRVPSHGREIACTLRGTKYARHIPIVFVGGEPEKVAVIRALLPDAIYTSIPKLTAALKTASEKRPEQPAVPRNAERYGNRTVAQKLGIKEGMTVAVHQAPRDYFAAIGELPANVDFIEDPDEVYPLTLWFVRDPREYRAAMPAMRRAAPKTKLWVIWHKASAGGQLTDKLVREFALDAGLVDYKICAVDKRWSGMLFAVSKKI